MSRLSDLAAQATANKLSAEELAPYLETSRELAHQVSSRLGEMGMQTPTSELSNVAAQLGEANNSRWLCVGHLEDAILLINGAIAGTHGSGGGAHSATDSSGTSELSDLLGPTGSGAVRANSDGTTSYLTTWGGEHVEVRVRPGNTDEPNTPGSGPARATATGTEVPDQTEEGGNRIRRSAKASSTKLDDVQTGAKEYTKSTYDILKALDPPAKETSAITEQNAAPLTSPTGGAHMPHGVDEGQMGGNIAVWAVAGLVAIAKTQKKNK